jgi:hypothetical protein
MTHEPTALRVWLDEPGKRRSVEKLTAAVRKHVKHASVAYIESVVDGYYPPSRKLGQALASETGVDLGVIMAHPYRAKRAA